MKKIIVYGSPFWPGCAVMKEVLSDNDINFVYEDITAGMRQLKSFLKLRDTNEKFKDIRGTTTVGLPTVLVDFKDVYVGELTPDEIKQLKE